MSHSNVDLNAPVSFFPGPGLVSRDCLENIEGSGSRPGSALTNVMRPLRYQNEVQLRFGLGRLKRKRFAATRLRSWLRFYSLSPDCRAPVRDLLIQTFPKFVRLTSRMTVF